jgi:hypothetical protein
MAMGWDEDRTGLVEFGCCRPFSDMGQRHALRVDDTSKCRQEPLERLAGASLAVDATGTDSHTADSFDIAVSEGVGQGDG